MTDKNKRYGYPIDIGYIGFVNGEKRLFETEDAYNEWMNDSDEEKEKGNENESE